MGFGKTNENEVFSYHEIQLKKTMTKKLLDITIDEYLNFNKHIKNVCMSAESFMHYRKCLLFLAINRKRLGQALSSVHNSVIVLLFECLVLLGLTEKSTN